MRSLRSFEPWTAGLLLVAAGAAAAHTAWLEPDAVAAGTYVVRFGGHGGKTEAYAPEKLKSVQARDAKGAALVVATSVHGDGVRVAVKGAPAVLGLHFDNGIYSRAPDARSVPRPMNENPGATQGTHAVKYGKFIAQWGEIATRPLGQPFEVVPVSAAAPRAGQPWKLRVLIGGKPAAGVRVGVGEDGPQSVTTDADGVATVLPQPGLNKLWSGRRSQVAGDPRFTELSIEYLLAFELR